MGNINLRLSREAAITSFAGHVGYEIFPEHRGHRYAAHAVRLLLPIAHSHGLETLWITCDPHNAASRRTLELAGAEYVETVPVLLHNAIFLPGNPQKCRHRLATNPGDLPSEQQP